MVGKAAFNRPAALGAACRLNCYLGMRQWIRFPIHTALLVAFLTACAAPLLAYWYWSYSQALRDDLDGVSGTHVLVAQNISADLQRFHGDVVSTFAALAAAMDEGEDGAQMQPVLDRLGFSFVCQMDPESGEVLRAGLAHPDWCDGFVTAERREQFALMTQGDAGARISGVMTAPGAPPHICVIDGAATPSSSPGCPPSISAPSPGAA